jgi:hypothetical protein
MVAQRDVIEEDVSCLCKEEAQEMSEEPYHDMAAAAAHA